MGEADNGEYIRECTLHRRQRREDDRGDGEGQGGWAVLDGVVSLSFIRKLRFQQSRR